MEFSLYFARFSLPDDWRDTSTYRYLAPRGEGTLVVETSREPRDSPELLQTSWETFLAVWRPALIYQKEFLLQRPTEPSLRAIEGELTSLDATGRHRFALVPLVSTEWAAVMTFLLQPRQDFLALVARATASFAFADEPPPVSPSPLAKRVRPYGAQLDIPRDWAGPTTLEFMDAEMDDVDLTITIDEPMAPAGTIRWASKVSGPIRILHETITPSHSGWTAEWALERPRPHSSPYLVRKAAVGIGDHQKVTVYGRAPQTAGARLDPGWNAVLASLRATTAP
jgi:hypothetical protein